MTGDDMIRTHINHEFCKPSADRKGDHTIRIAGQPAKFVQYIYIYISISKSYIIKNRLDMFVGCLNQGRYTKQSIR